MLLNNRKFYKGKKGFTLVEMVISVAFLAVISIFLLQLFISADNLRLKTYDLDKSVAASRQMIETIKVCVKPEDIKACELAKHAVIKDADGAMNITLYYDKEWKVLDKPDSSGQKKAAFVINSVLKPANSGNAGGKSRIYDIGVKAIKTGLYTLEKKRENELYSVNAVKYFAVR